MTLDSRRFPKAPPGLISWRFHHDFIDGGISVISKIRGLALLAGCVAATSSFGQTLIFTGELTSADPVFNRPTSTTALSITGTAVAYDVYTFVASAAGPYSITGNYTAGGVGSPTGLDGFLFLYAGTFNPATALVNLAAADDDWVDPDGAGPISAFDGSAIPSTGSFGPLTTTTTLSLVPGATYRLVVSGFSNATVATGLGPYTLTVVGAVPEASTYAMMLAGLGALGLARCRQRTGQASQAA
ncbi:MAG: PEP-CTERM sorting domain-containing protein [Chitinophagaceae bacterium]|nr:PEP-CTERM sorting domain-containing protein [Rubrivivax sp.]